jgi:hypothetical protein
MTPSRTNHLLISLAALFCITQCQKEKAQPPKAEGFDPPIPPAISYLAGPVTFQLKELENKINRELDPVLVGKDTKGGKAGGIVSFRIVRSGPVQIRYESQQVKFSAPLQLFLAKPFSSDKTAPEKPFCALHVNFQSPLTVTPDWRLSSQVKFVDYQWIIPPEIRLLGMEISLTNFAQKIIERHRTDIETAIDSAIHRDLRLDKTVSPIWHDIQNPLLINKEYGLWLLPRPVSVAASSITGNNDSISTHLRIAFETKTELKAETPVYPKTKLPPLQKRDTVSQVSDLHLMSFIPYEDINQMLARKLSKEPKKLAMGALTVKQASVYGGQHALIVKAELSGLLNGTIYLRGRPMFDTLTNTLRIQNLDFDAGTKSALPQVTSAAWNNGLRQMLEGLLAIPLGDDIAQLPDKIQQAFKKGEASKKTDLGIRAFRFIPQKIAIRPDGFQALIKVTSNVGVQVKKL